MKTSQYYLKAGDEFGWGHSSAKINPEKRELLDKYVKGNVIDIGCGSGVYTKYLQEKGHEVIGIDNVKQFVDLCRRKYRHINFYLSSATSLPFKKHQFDTAVLFDVLEHTDDTKALTQAGKVAKRIIISVPLKNSKLLRQYSLAHHHYLDKSHRRTYTAVSLRKLIIDSGLEPVMVKKALPISLTGLYVSHLAQKSKIRRIILKMLLKPFLPEPQIFSAIFAVADAGKR